MDIRDIVRAVDKAYSPLDNGVLEAVLDDYEHQAAKHGVEGEPYSAFESEVGDDLAAFVVKELLSAHDPKAGTDEQLANAARVMGVAADQLRRVAEALEDLK